jgi:hypothetical protein
MKQTKQITLIAGFLAISFFTSIYGQTGLSTSSKKAIKAYEWLKWPSGLKSTGMQNTY